MTEFPAIAHHVGLTVTDLEVTRQWYQRLLNTAPVLDEEVPAVPRRHQGFHKVVFVLQGGFVLALVGHPATDRNHRFDEVGPGLDHLSFGCADQKPAREVAEASGRAGINHGVIAEDAVGFALPFRDPDNIALEFWAPRS